jgi:hypothetical protein
MAAKHEDIASLLTEKRLTADDRLIELDLEAEVYRVEVVEMMLSEGIHILFLLYRYFSSSCTGIPLNKVDSSRGLRRMLEHNNHNLAGRSFLSYLVPHVLKMQRERIHGLITGKMVSCIFDGTTAGGEAMAILVRIVDEELNIRQMLVKFDVLATSCNALTLAVTLNDVLVKRYQVTGILAWVHDRATVNAAGISRLDFAFPPDDTLDVGCFSHTLDNVGKALKIPHARKFIKRFHAIFKNSCAARKRWLLLTGEKKRGYSMTRWWSWLENLNQCFRLWEHVQPFVAANPDICPKSMRKMSVLLSDSNWVKQLRVELAATVDIGMKLLRATYIPQYFGSTSIMIYILDI